jgi:two-component system, OmpR family, response regulator ChvI
MNSTIEDDDFLRYNDFPIVGFNSGGSINNSDYNDWSTSAVEVSFSGQWQDHCICFIDMVNSTKITSRMPGEQICKYYAIFLNAMATIVKNFGARILKNAGDSLIYYFPEASDPNKKFAFRDVVECCITMIAAHRTINARLRSEELPPVDYRISADYGRSQLAKSTVNQTDDLFGSTINLCVKINSMASPNELVIGHRLYGIVKSSFDDYQFEKKGEYTFDPQNLYPVYALTALEKRNILNPFRRRSKLELSFPLSPSAISEFNLKIKHLEYSEQTKLTSHTHPKVMLVDDESDALFTYKYMLADEGYSVEAFTDSQEALQHFTELDPKYYDLVIADIRMPVLNGLELFQRIKAINRAIKVLFISALEPAAEMTSILPDVSASDFIRKPVEKDDFIKTVRKAVSSVSDLPNLD